MTLDAEQLLMHIRRWATELGFSQIGVAALDIDDDAAQRLRAWLDAGFHGSMHYMQRHAALRVAPKTLVPGAVRVVTVRMDYLPRDGIGVASLGTADNEAIDNQRWRKNEWQRIDSPDKATVSVYARGRDYHKVMRTRLQQLADRIAAHIGPFGHRAFTDSAPVMEVELAARSGQAWRGKHTLALSRDAGSMFFLGELFVDILLPLTEPVSNHCGECQACIDVCPTRAIVAPYRLDARRCIAYLTIEHEGAIPLDMRAPMGNRIFGCDDCQLVCPWNKYAARATVPDFDARAVWQDARLLDLWQWSEATFLQQTQGTVLRRSGFERWRRNLAVALGNARRAAGDPGRPASVTLPSIDDALLAARPEATAMVAEHVDWALAQTWAPPLLQQQSPSDGARPSDSAR